MPPAGEVNVWMVRLGTGPAGAVPPGGGDSPFPPGGGDCPLPRRAPSKRSLVSHVALRLVLGEITGTAPERLRFERRCGHCGGAGHGKPRLAGRSDLDFSISHSGELALIAVARGRRVGADVERVRPRTDVLAIARGSLSARERRAIEALATDEARREAFFRCWTRKEAYLKALGVGLAGGLDTDPEQARGWQIRSLPAPPGYMAAVAAEGQFVLRQRTTLWPPNPKLFERATAPRPFRVRPPRPRDKSVT
jgi:4'-phosphopantetheinyl transferase